MNAVSVVPVCVLVYTIAHPFILWVPARVVYLQTLSTQLDAAGVCVVSVAGDGLSCVLC